MESSRFLIVLRQLVLLEELVNLPVEEYLLMQVSRHFQVVSLHEANNLSQRLLIGHVLKNIRDKEVEDLV